MCVGGEDRAGQGGEPGVWLSEAWSGNALFSLAFPAASLREALLESSSCLRLWHPVRESRADCVPRALSFLEVLLNVSSVYGNIAIVAIAIPRLP